MITPSDRDYKTTKRVKQGKKRLSTPFAELAHWISEKWSVRVLNVRYDRRNSRHAPRVQVILEYESHVRTFHCGVNFDAAKQKAVAKRFCELIDGGSRRTFDVDGLFVIFEAFAPVAKQEADGKVSDAEVQALMKRIGNPDVWDISRCFGHVTVFFFTDDQVKRYEADGKKREYAKRYFDLLKPHDEFGYLKESQFTIDFDSKQNFDENYESNWFYYYH